jgi:hypothetical protein
MDNLIEKIKEYVMEECRKYKEASEEHYDFWNTLADNALKEECKQHSCYLPAESNVWFP